MKFTVAIDDYVRDMRSQGRINSDASERAYRSTLYTHAEDIDNRDPRYVSRRDVKRTLERWSNPNSQGTRRSHLVSFYRWVMWEGMRTDNPAEATRPPKRRKPTVYRLSRSEVLGLLGAVRDERERRAIYLAVYAGLRSGELRGLQGKHFARDGVIDVSPDIAKGRRGRTIPVSPELAPIVADIQRTTNHDHYVLPSQRFRDPGINRETEDRREHPMSAKALWELVRRVGKRAGIAAPIHPHLLRHACADQLVRQVGLRPAQAILGHAGLATTEGYLGPMTVDELTAAITGFAFGVVSERKFYPRLDSPANPVEAPAGIEPA